jgi:hypothetical protein
VRARGVGELARRRRLLARYRERFANGGSRGFTG